MQVFVNDFLNIYVEKKKTMRPKRKKVKGSSFDYAWAKQAIINGFLDISVSFISVVQALSIFKNAQKIFKVTENSETFECIHGIKALSMTWIILSHTYLNMLMGPTSLLEFCMYNFICLECWLSMLFFYTDNKGVFVDWSKQFWMAWFFNSVFSVDTFFLLRFIEYLFILFSFRP